MISIIICSKQSIPTAKIKSNISKTIGDIPFELVWIDNSENKYNIFQAYNYGFKKAKYPFLCFLHEDIVFHSNNWGKKIIDTLDDEKIGLAGVIGGYHIGKFSLSWIDSGLYYAGNILQGEKFFGIYKTKKTNNKNCAGTRVAAVDGLFLCLKKKLFDKSVIWDENTYSNFHFYDLDMAMQIHQLGLEIHVIPEIIIEHKSLGNRTHSFYEECIKFHKKWNKQLPITMPDFSLPKEQQQEDILILNKYLNSVEKADKIRRYFHFLLNFKQLFH